MAVALSAQDILERLSNDELNLTHFVTPIKHVAGGAFGDVWQGILQVNNNSVSVAVKFLRISSGPSTMQIERLYKRLLREIHVWRNLNHENIALLYGFTKGENDSPALISPWYPNGDAIRYLKTMEEVNRPSLLLQCARGLCYLHENNIVHGDIKGENVLIDERGGCRLCDFGMMKFTDSRNIPGLSSSNPSMGTIRFTCPERLDEGVLTPMCDVWAFGCMALQIMLDIYPYHEFPRPSTIITRILSGISPIPSTVAGTEEASDSKFWDHIRRCCAYESEERPSIQDILHVIEELFPDAISDAASTLADLHISEKVVVPPSSRNVEDQNSAAEVKGEPLSGHNLPDIRIEDSQKTQISTQAPPPVADHSRTRETDLSSSPLPSTLMPLNPTIFGRSEYVNEALKLILSSGSSRLAILGPGGIGKTSVALKIIHDPQVIGRFGNSRHWIPCEQATSLPLLVELLARSLDLKPTQSNDRLKEVMTALESSDQPHIFLLDNFETPWDLEGRQSEVAEVVARLASLTNVSLMVTMRSGEYPAPDQIDWSRPRLPLLQQLSLDAARQAFLRICPDAADDAQLDTIIKELDCVPLAVTLMAKLADAGDSPSELLISWRKERTRLLHQPGGDKRNSIEVSIMLSLQSSMIRADPSSVQLLNILSQLPGGASLIRLPELCRSILVWKRALRILRRVALAYESPDKQYIHVLSPIRAYMLLHHPLEARALQDVRDSYFKLAERGDAELEDPEFPDASKELSREEPNMDVILMEALHANPEVQERAIRASICYSYYLYWTHPRSEIILEAVAVARATNSKWVAQSLRRLGGILELASEYDQARLALDEARMLFVEEGNQLGAALSLREIGHILQLQYQHDDALTALEKAKSELMTLDHHLGMGQCLQGMGIIHRMRNEYQQAQSRLQEARVEFEAVGNRLGVAQCLKNLADLLLVQQQQYDTASLFLEQAQVEFTSLKDPLGIAQCFQTRGTIRIIQDRYNDARSEFEEAKSQFTTAGEQIGVGQCLASLGSVALMQGQYSIARSELEEARSILIRFGHPLASFCSQQLALLPSQAP